MTTDSQDHRDYGFIYGLLTGMVVGAGLAMWLVPRLAVIAEAVQAQDHHLGFGRRGRPDGDR